MWPCGDISSGVINNYAAIGTLFTQTLQTFLTAQCALVGDHLWPPDVDNSVLRETNYDFIVVGAGSAGAVVANRLSEIPHWNVLLIEAGGNPTLATETPQIFLNNLNSSIDWRYKAEKQDGACKGYKTKRCSWPRAKVLGGCSSINAMFYVRGNKLDYDEWAAAGNQGWSYEDVLPYFKKSENYENSSPSQQDLKYHGKGGYLNTLYSKEPQDIESILIKAVTEVGLPYLPDINGNDQIGVTSSASTIKNGVRQSTARAFLSPIRDRKNMHVLKNGLVTKILFKPDSKEVSGVEVEKGGTVMTINANKEIIISGGAINTPQLLMLSGIGPQKHLKDLGIDVRADLPVGENLQDHVYVPILFKMPLKFDLAFKDIAESLNEYVLHQKGMLATVAPHRIISFFNSTDSKAYSPDLQQHYLAFPPGVTKLVDMFKGLDFSEEIQTKFKEVNKDHLVIVIYMVLLRPKSKGRILLKSTNPHEHPIIYANYFDDNEDLKTLIRGIKQLGFKLGETKSFKQSGINLHWFDIDACRGLHTNTEEFLECWTRELTTTLYHPAGTAKMGPENDETAVVDKELRVKKVYGLRVIDTSIMPDIVRGNTNAPAIMTGEKGSDMIKEYWLKHENKIKPQL